ncbi:hypothetical protein E1301_Tti003443 [Triplophysa tibetana]|uniref:Uncharacterized protein n=1 Tax=Triplophysa tibetana TaxID=1572043 RepID=A0A5A9PPF8_9TELE|nr:hypothetical protein E1301_Tti003443 [Triplophysa tibetana]
MLLEPGFKGKSSVYKWQASASVCTLGRRLHEQEEDFAGKAASYQREIGHLQSQLKDRQEQLHGALQQKRRVTPSHPLPLVSSLPSLFWLAGHENESKSKHNRSIERVVEGELEVVWEATTRESQRLREVALRTSSLSAATMAPVLRNTFSQSPARIPSVEDHFFSTILPLFSTTQNGLPRPLHRSPMFESDSDQHQNPESSDENEKSRQD